MSDTADDTIETTRDLLCRAQTATLATLLPPTGAPFASLALVARDYDSSPILLLSDLAEHATNIAGDNRVSLLFDGTQGLDDPLSGARASLQGRAERSDDPRHRARYLARHPSARGYAEFGDFAFYSVVPERAHLVAGFGRIAWLDWAELETQALPALAAAEADIIAHMNDDHRDALDLMAGAFAAAGTGWAMTGIDCAGFDLRRGGDVLRLAFDAPIRNTDDARKALVALTARARSGGN